MLQDAMNQIARRPMSLDEFLAWEREQDGKYEFDGTGPVAMTGASVHHRRICDDLTRAINDRLGDRGCEALAGDLKVIVDGRVRYPDVVVTCAPLDGFGDIVPEPIVVVEVLSESTARIDRKQKVDEYHRKPSIEHYLILKQDAVEGVLFSRDGLDWREEPVGRSVSIVFKALDVTIPLAEVYRRVIAPG